MVHTFWRDKLKRVAQSSIILLSISALAVAVFPQTTRAATGGTLRQEINLLNKVKSFNNATASTERVGIDDADFGGNTSFYLEVVASKTAGATGSINLRSFYDTVATINLTQVGTTPSRIRVPVTFVSSWDDEYYLTAHTSLPTSSVTLRSARVIAIQNSPAGVHKTSTQIEIGNNETGKNNTVSAPLTAPKYWKYNASNWDGTKNFYAEVVKKQSRSDFTTTVTLQQDNGSFSGWTNVATIVSDTNTATTRYRVPFTPVDGRNYRLASFQNIAGTNKIVRNYDIYSGKIIVNQSSQGPIAAQQHLAGSDFFGQLAQVGQSFKSGVNGPLESIEMVLTNTGAATADMKIDVYACSGTWSQYNDSNNFPTGPVLATSDVVSSATVGGGWVTFPFSGANRISLTSGGVYCFVAHLSSGIMAHNYDEVGGGNVFQRASDSDPWQLLAGHWRILTYRVNAIVPPVTKLEPQYLLLNTADSNVTGLLNYRTLWDANEWAGVNNVYKFAIDSNHASNAAKLQKIDNGIADVTGSPVTGANQKVSGPLTMPASGQQLDVNVTNTSGVISAGRILVEVSVPQ